MSRIIAVIGATGAQGGSVVRYILKHTDFAIRAQTRDVTSAGAKAVQALSPARVSLVAAEITDSAALAKLFAGAYGVFSVSMFWNPQVGLKEQEISENVAKLAKAAGVRHFVWSTLADAGKISGGKYKVPHFTLKGRVDATVAALGFEYYTFVAAPMYLSAFTSMMKPQKQGDTLAWNLPLAGDKKVVHLGDIDDLGKIVAAAFKDPAQYGKGARLYLSAGLYSFNELIAILTAVVGKKFVYNAVSAETWNSWHVPAGEELLDMFNFEAEYGYYGPNAQQFADAGSKAAVEPIKTVQQWAVEQKAFFLAL